MNCLDLDATNTIEEVVALVRKWADSHPKDDWIIGSGFKERVAPVEAFDVLASCGITYVQDCYVPVDWVPEYLEAAKSGALSCRVNIAPLIHRVSIP